MPGSKVRVHHDVESLKSGGCASDHQGGFFSQPNYAICSAHCVRIAPVSSERLLQPFSPSLRSLSNFATCQCKNITQNSHASTEGPAIFYCCPSQLTGGRCSSFLFFSNRFGRHYLSYTKIRQTKCYKQHDTSF